MSKLRDYCRDNAVLLRRFHGWATMWWCTFGVALSIIYKDSIIWVVFMSLYANVAGEFSAWQSARVEVKQDEAAGPCEKCGHSAT